MVHFESEKNLTLNIMEKIEKMDISNICLSLIFLICYIESFMQTGNLYEFKPMLTFQ